MKPKIVVINEIIAKTAEVRENLSKALEYLYDIDADNITEMIYSITVMVDELHTDLKKLQGVGIC